MDLHFQIDTGKNALVNADNVTLLRNINLVQGATYTVYLGFRNNAAVTVAPAISTLTLESPYMEVNTGLTDTGDSTYPKSFTLLADTQALTNALNGVASINSILRITYSSGIANVNLLPVSVTFNSGNTGYGVGGEDVNGNTIPLNINALPVASTLQATDLFIVEQADGTKKVTKSNVMPDVSGFATSSALSAEASTRASADSGLQTQINAKAAASDLTAEATTRASADTTLQGEITILQAVAPYNAGNITGTVTLSYSNGKFQKAALTGDITLNASNGVEGASLRLWLTASGADRNLSFNTAVKIPSDSGISLPKTLTSGKSYIVLLQNNGSSWWLTSLVGGF